MPEIRKAKVFAAFILIFANGRMFTTNITQSRRRIDERAAGRTCLGSSRI